MRTSAVIDPTGAYRYRLRREWDDTLPRTCFVMLNPSTADATLDDPTIRRCIGFSRFWGCGSVEVVNLFALRSTDPRALLSAADPVGAENDQHIREASTSALVVVAAWGAHGALLNRDRKVMRLLDSPQCLGVTSAGFPRHPLYVAGSTSLVRYGGRP